MYLKIYYVRSKQKVLTKMLLITKITSILILAACVQASAKLSPLDSPPFEVHGIVIDQDGNPLTGASVFIVGTENGTTTNNDGRFTIDVPGANAIIQISSVGFVAKRVTVGNQTEITVTLEADITGLTDVVVVGYGTEKKINLTGAVSSVTSKVLENRPITTIGQGLQGVISNLNIAPDIGSLGQAPSFNIRGYTSINGGGPLILVDGVPMDINRINPNDVDNVVVLKDAASAAIYGARAAYGVMLVTTKSGQKGTGKPKISLESYFASNRPTSKMEFMDSKERMDFMNEGNLRVNGRNYFSDEEMAAILAHYNDPTQPNAIIKPLSDEWTGVSNTDWEKILQRESYPMQHHSINLSGGSDKFDYYTSFAYLNQKGIINKDLFDEHFNQYNFMANINYHAYSWLTIGTKINMNNNSKRYAPTDFDENNNAFLTSVVPNLPYQYPDGSWSHFGSVGNPAQMLLQGGYRTRATNESWLTGLIKLKPVKNVTFNLDYSTKIQNTKNLNYVSLVPFFNAHGDLTGYQGSSSPNRVVKRNDNNRYFVFNAYGDYTNTFNEKHYFKTMIGFNQESSQSSWEQAERRNLIVNSIPYLNLATGQSFVGDGITEFAIRGAFGRVNYIFDDRYLFEFNGRYDGTSKFPTESRFAFFPSVSVGWRVDNENFFGGLKNTINQLKFRASYGNLGNQNVGAYPYIATMSAKQVDYILGGSNVPMSVYTPGLVSASLTWETVSQKNLGVDFGILSNKLSGSFDIYKRETKNMLTKSRTLSAVLGENEPKTNAADLKTTGFDLNLSWHDKIGRDVTYGITAVFSDYNAEITKFDNPAGLISDYYVGKDLGEIWGLKTGGLFKTDAEAEALDQSNINGRKRQAGDLWMVDLNNDNKITRGAQTLSDHGDMSIIGNSTPRYSFGFTTNIGWKGFDLDIFLQGVGKRDTWLSTLYWLTQYQWEAVAIPKEANDYWTPDNLDAYWPRPIMSQSSDILAVQSRFLQNSSYIRLKQLTLSYTIPSDLTKKAGIGGMRVFFSGSNLWTGTKMVKIADPEIAGVGRYPLYSSLSLGVNINL